MISVIVPVYNEEKTVEDTINLLSGLYGDKEVIIVDGGSIDNTYKIAENHKNNEKFKLIKSEKGRANQMNTGVESSSGSILWFLHSDSKIERDSLLDIEKAITDGYDGGCFSLYFHDYDNKKLKFISWSSNLRAKYLKLIFGDQGMFMTRALFDDIGGFKNIPIMEDWEMSRAMYNKGKIKVLKSRIGTSARRFVSGGEIKTLLNMHKIKSMHIRGVKPEEIVRKYRDIR